MEYRCMSPCSEGIKQQRACPKSWPQSQEPKPQAADPESSTAAQGAREPAIPRRASASLRLMSPRKRHCFRACSQENWDSHSDSQCPKAGWDQSSARSPFASQGIFGDWDLWDFTDSAAKTHYSQRHTQGLARLSQKSHGRHCKNTTIQNLVHRRTRSQCS